MAIDVEELKNANRVKKLVLKQGADRFLELVGNMNGAELGHPQYIGELAGKILEAASCQEDLRYNFEEASKAPLMYLGPEDLDREDEVGTFANQFAGFALTCEEVFNKVGISTLEEIRAYKGYWIYEVAVDIHFVRTPSGKYQMQYEDGSWDNLSSNLLNLLIEMGGTIK